MVFRINKTENYTVMGNYHLREKELSLKAKGLMSLMLSLPKDWNYSINGLAKLSKGGKDSVMSALSELESLGYIARTRSVNEKGQFNGYDYEVYEHPCSEKPYTENPNTENPLQINTNILNTNINKKEKENILKEKEKSFNTEDLDLWFSKIYSLYPRKASKLKAREAFEHKVRGLTKDLAYKKSISIYRLLEKQLLIWEKEQREPSFIPYLASWLNANIEDSPNYKRGRK